MHVRYGIEAAVRHTTRNLGMSHVLTLHLSEMRSLASDSVSSVQKEHVNGEDLPQLTYVTLTRTAHSLTRDNTHDS